MGCIALVRCVFVLRCDLAGVVWCGIRMQAEALHLCYSTELLKEFLTLPMSDISPARLFALHFLS